MDGSFIQEWLCAQWSDAMWQKEFSSMKEAGMHYLIIGPVADWQSNGTIKTLYPSSLPNTVLYSPLNGDDMVERCLRNAQEAGIKIFLGIGINQNWWGVHGADTAWFYSQMAFDNQVCDELWDLYKSKYPDSFYGWYWAYEIDNVSFMKPEQQEELAAGMNIQLDHLSSTGKKLPFMWCPFMNAEAGTADAYKSMWINVLSKLHTTPGDIFSPQDLCGKGGYNLEEMDVWFKALREAVNTKPGLELWPDVETFNFDGTSATIDRLVDQMKVEQPYSDNYISFATCHFDSPNNIDPGFHNTYLDYLKNGIVETNRPSAPSNIKAQAKTDGTINLSWDASEDNIGICGYYLYRDDSQILKEQVPILNGAMLTPLPTTITDVVLKPNSEYKYSVKAYDFANNISDAGSVTVTTDSISYFANNIAQGCSYTVSAPADDKYPDTDNSELTNGRFPRTASKGDPGWQGYYEANKLRRSITIDLGSIQAVQQFMGYYLYDSTASITLPKQVLISVSSDNIAYSDAGELAVPKVAAGSKASSYRCISTLDNEINTRYIRFTVIPSSAWTFDDEYEVRNNKVTGVNDDKNELTPSHFTLYQNNPNPFNPSTIISYNIPAASKVTLDVYDLLGRHVQSLLNDYQEQGSHSISFNASGLSSGVYFYRIVAGQYTATRQMVLIR